MKRLFKDLVIRFTSWLVIEPSELNVNQWVNDYLAKHGYSKYGNTYTKGFVIIEVTKGKITISHDGNQIKYEISENLPTGLILSENYFQRI
jgi:hypothetical protein